MIRMTFIGVCWAVLFQNSLVTFNRSRSTLPQIIDYHTFKNFCLYMCLCVTRMCSVYMCMCMHMCGGQKSVSSVSLYCSPPYSLFAVVLTLFALWGAHMPHHVFESHWENHSWFSQVSEGTQVVTSGSSHLHQVNCVPRISTIVCVLEWISLCSFC